MEPPDPGENPAQLRSQLAALTAINTVLRSTRALLPVYRTIAAELGGMLQYDSLLIGIYDPQTGVLRYEYGWDEGVVDEGLYERRLADAPLSERVIGGGQPANIPDLLADPISQRLRRFGQDDRPSRAWLGVPLISSGQTRGIIAVMRYTPQPFTAADQDLLVLLASQLALAVEGLGLERQLRATIAQLSTPILPVAEGVLVLPLIGQIDSSRAQLIAERTLDAVVERQAERVLLDVTGVALVDDQVLAALLKVVRAVELLGAHCAVVGVSAALAATITALGVDLSQLHVYRDLQTALSK